MAVYEFFVKQLFSNKEELQLNELITENRKLTESSNLVLQADSIRLFTTFDSLREFLPPVNQTNILNNITGANRELFVADLHRLLAKESSNLFLIKNAEINAHWNRLTVRAQEYLTFFSAQFDSNMNILPHDPNDTVSIILANSMKDGHYKRMIDCFVDTFYSKLSEFRYRNIN